MTDELIKPPLEEHPLPGQLRAVVAEMAEAHGLELKAFNAVANGSGGIAMFLDLSKHEAAPLTGKLLDQVVAAAPAASEAVVPEQLEGDYKILPAHAKALATALKDNHHVSLNKALNGLLSQDLLIGNFKCGDLYKVNEFNGTSAVGGQKLCGDGAGQSMTFSMNADDRPYLPTTSRGQKVSVGDEVFIRIRSVVADVPVRWATGKVLSVHGKKLEIDLTSSKGVKADMTLSLFEDVWVPMESKSAPAALETEAPAKVAKPTKRERLKGRKPGAR